MRPCTLAVAALALVAGCGSGEPATAAAITHDYSGHMGRTLHIDGTVVRYTGAVTYVWIGLADYFTVEDSTGRINVWFGMMTCKPRIGSRVTVVGKVTKPEKASFHIFNLKRLKVHSSPPVGKDEVRECMLPREEQEIYGREGIEGLQYYWKEHGKPFKKVVN